MSWLLLFFAALASAATPAFERRFEEIRKSATPQQLYAFLYDLPKGGDLHHHFGLAIPPEGWFERATAEPRMRGDEFYTRLRISFCPDDTGPPVRFHTVQRATWQKFSDCRKADYTPLASLSAELRAQWISSLKLDRPGEGRHEFFEAIVHRVSELTRDPNVVLDLMADTLKRYGAEGLRYLESQVNASGFRDPDGNPIDPDRGAELIRARMAQPDVRSSGVTVRFLSVFLRYHPQAEANLERAYAFVDRHRDLWVGINFAGREDNDKGYPLRFLDTFRKMRRTYSGIGLSIHAGEKDAPGRQVRETLLLGADRIGHGVNLISDPDTMLLMRNNRFLVEVQLISNRLLEYTPDLSKHPFPEYLRMGIPVCLNTDDPGAWDSNLTDEYYTAVKTFNLTWREVVTLGRNSLAYSFAEPDLKARLLKDYEAAVERFETKYSAEDWREAVGRVRAVSSGYAERNFGVRF